MKRDVIDKLKMVLPELKTVVDNESKQVKGVEICVAIQTHIDEICYQEQLRNLEKKYREKFNDHFPADIPHNDTMPSDFLFHINLKDTNKIVQQ
jgi:hypothetical protein